MVTAPLHLDDRPPDQAFTFDTHSRERTVELGVDDTQGSADAATAAASTANLKGTLGSGKQQSASRPSFLKPNLLEHPSRGQPTLLGTL
jgi:hypothetical protein